jgi:hypothetical protein
MSQESQILTRPYLYDLAMCQLTNLETRTYFSR